jgi:hypothetical protein
LHDIFFEVEGLAMAALVMVTGHEDIFKDEDNVGSDGGGQEGDLQVATLASPRHVEKAWRRNDVSPSSP